jgi:uncharacterized protein YndB with AHSA1/START domain
MVTYFEGMTSAVQTEQNTRTVQVHRVYIRATPEAIWDAIIKPEFTEKYGYACRAEFDLRPGGSFRALANEGMVASGSPEVAVDGEVVEADPPRKLVQTWCMLMDPGLIAEGFTTLTYEIEQRQGGVSALTVTHDLTGAPKLAVLLSGALENTGAGGGWNFTLSSLKTLLETGEPLNWPG